MTICGAGALVGALLVASLDGLVQVRQCLGTQERRREQRERRVGAGDHQEDRGVVELEEPRRAWR